MNKQESLRDRAFTRRALGFYLALVGLGLLLTGATRTCAAQGATGRAESRATVAPSPTPLLTEVRGVRLGMTEAEVRSVLSRPASSAGDQALFVKSSSESVTVHYDAERRVRAITVTFTHEATNIPTPRAVLGEELTPGADGAMHRLIQYRQHGYWVAYTRTAGSEPLTIVTMKGMPAAAPAVESAPAVGGKPLTMLDEDVKPQPPPSHDMPERDMVT